MSLNDKEWLTEVYEERTAFSVRISGILFDEKSDFQRIQIYQTSSVGRVLILNGCFMVTEKDAFIYHEMLVHPAMHALPDPRRVLIIGGGDGGAVTELVKYPFLESIVLCEIDPLVVKSCRQFFPEISAGLDDPRVKVVCEDGAAYIRDSDVQFDLVLVDSTDPVGPAKALFETGFFQSVKRNVGRNGVAVFQTESPLFMEDVFRNAVNDLRTVFGSDGVSPYLATIPCYPGGLWSFSFCSEGLIPVGRATGEPVHDLSGPLRYYDSQVHSAAFALPIFVRETLGRGL